MPPYQLKVADDVYKQLKKLAPAERSRVIPAILALEEDPLPPGKKWKRLKATEESLIRLRVGDYRVVYEVLEDTVNVLAVVHRHGLEHRLRRRQTKKLEGRQAVAGAKAGLSAGRGRPVSLHAVRV